jgi:hypothetical protein
MIEKGKLYLYNTSDSGTNKTNYKLVLITGGDYIRNDRISNFWEFTYINPLSGQLTRKKGSDYDNRINGFIKVSEKLYDPIFVLSKFWSKYFIGNYGKKSQIHERKKRR